MNLEDNNFVYGIIAEVCHEANRAFCISIGDNSQPSWKDAPDWQKVSAINGVEFHFNNRNSPASASHDNWLKFKIEDGWKYGPEKDPEKKEHPCIVPYEQLPINQQIKDHIFRSICHAYIEVIFSNNVIHASS